MGLKTMKLEFWIAWRYLKNVRREGFVSTSSWFSFVGIALGVATLIIVMSVMNGFRANLLERILGVQGHFVVTAKNIEGRRDFDALRQNLLALGGAEILQLSPLIDAQLLADSGSAADGILLRSLPASEIKARPHLRDSITASHAHGWDSFDANRGLYMGVRLAKRLKLGIGDKVKLIAPQFSFTGFGSVPRIKTYAVSGIFEVGMYQYDNNIAFLPLAEARHFFKLEDADYYALEGLLRVAEKARELTQQWQEQIGENYYISNWQDNNAALVSALKVERNVMFIILTLIILVAAFNIIAGQVMLVKNKSRGIALLLSFGGTSAVIMRIFLVCGSLIGIAGTALGAIIGTLFALNIESISNFIENLWNIELFSREIYYLSELPSQVQWGDVILVCGMALLISLLAALYPALQAAHVAPAQQLRYE